MLPILSSFRGHTSRALFGNDVRQLCEQNQSTATSHPTSSGRGGASTGGSCVRNISIHILTLRENTLDDDDRNTQTWSAEPPSSVRQCSVSLELFLAPPSCFRSSGQWLIRSPTPRNLAERTT